jgi:MFS superfamily sulfate permease-like transporter
MERAGLKMKTITKITFFVGILYGFLFLALGIVKHSDVISMLALDVIVGYLIGYYYGKESQDETKH